MASGKTTVTGILGSSLVLLMVTLACQTGGSAPEADESAKLMTELRTKLETGHAFEAEKPFTIRALNEESWGGHAVAYGCYRKGQAPGQKGPSDAEIQEDLEIIAKHWNLIRLYGADDDTRRILRIIHENALPITVIQGIWLEPEENDPQEKAANIRSVLLGIELTNQYPDIVVAVSVGNETQVFWSAHQMELANAVRYIRAVRQSVTVPVTTADDYLYWNKAESRHLAEETDFIFSHVHPQWNGKSLDKAIHWLDSTYRELQKLHPEREVVIGETGWATDYNADKTGPGEQGALVKGEVSLDAQASFLIQLDQWVETKQVTTVLFEAFDEPWKGGGEDSPPNEIEKHWGVFNENRTPKTSFTTYLDSKRNATE